MIGGLYFLRYYNYDIIIEILSRYYGINPSANAVYQAIRHEAKLRKKTFRETTEDILREIGYLPKDLDMRNGEGIKRYLDENSNNQVDQEILKRVKERINKRKDIRKPGEDIVCRNILLKRLTGNNYNQSRRAKGNIKLDEIIEVGIQQRITRTGMAREEVIREAFCVEFNIKQNGAKTDIKVAQEISI